VVVSSEKIAGLREVLGADATDVCFADMADVGANPGRIIAAWREFVDRHRGARLPLRGIGEPVWAERSPAELVECRRHEELLNVAFDGSPAWWLLCPYDVASLGDGIAAEAVRTHPFVVDADGSSASPTYPGVGAFEGPLVAPLPEPLGAAVELAFSMASLGEVRRFVGGQALRAGIAPARVPDVELAVNELCTNSVRHGGGAGTCRTWVEGETFLCEVRDAGTILDPLAGRLRPGVEQIGGRGLWLANQVCDLVQIRATPLGGVVRLHVVAGS
jgi:anti-sigma regulatory factor (Ser/Thr protein kinase)